MIFRSAQEIASKIKTNLAKNIGLTSIQSGSIIETIINAFSVELEQGNRLAADLSNNLFLSVASGTYLDAVITFFGIKRMPGKRKTFIDGLRIYTSDGLPLNKYINLGFFTDLKVSSSSLGGRFIVMPPVTAASLNAGYIDLQAYIEDSDAPLYTIDSINKFLKDVHIRIKVTNLIETNIETTAEDDYSLRKRISKAMNGMQFGTNDSLYLAAYNVPEVANISIVENEHGPGTVSLYVVPKDLSSTAAAVYAVKKAVGTVVPAGIILNIMPVELVYVKICVEFETNSDLNKTYVEAVTKAALKHEIDNMSFGSTLTLDKIEKIIKASFSDEEPSVTVFEISKIDMFGVRYEVGDKYKYTLSNKERFCLETEKPITVTIRSSI